MVKTVLALDLGTKTGWALRSASGEVTSGAIDLRPRGTRYEGGGMRYLRFERWLTDRVLTADEVVFEEVRRHMSTDAAHVYGGLLAVLTKVCEQHGIPYRGIPVGTVKKMWTGKGNASKTEMVAWAHNRGYDPATEDEADALAILHTSEVA